MNLPLRALAALVLAMAWLGPTAQAQRRVPLLTAPTGAPATAEVVAWRARAVPLARRPGAYRLVLTGRIAEGWRVYAMDAASGRPLAVVVDALPDGFWLERAPAHTDRPETGRDDALGTPYTYFDGEVEVAARLRTAPRARRGRHVVGGAVTYAACNDRVCLPPRTERFEAAVVVERAR